MMTNQAGQFADVAFVSYFNATWNPGTATPASVVLSPSAKAAIAARKASR